MARYEIRIDDNGVETYVPETLQGIFDGVPLSQKPAGATPVYVAAKIGRKYTPEAGKGMLTMVDMGESKSKYGLSIDVRPAEVSHADWEKAGCNKFSQWTSDQTGGLYPFSGVPDAKKFVYQTESALHGDKEGFWYWASSLADMEQNYINRINGWGAGVIWTANVETSNYWPRWYHGDANGSGILATIHRGHKSKMSGYS